MLTLWILLLVSMIEWFLENLTDLPMPLRKFQEEVQEENCDTAINDALPLQVSSAWNKILNKYSNYFSV